MHECLWTLRQEVLLWPLLFFGLPKLLVSQLGRIRAARILQDHRHHDDMQFMRGHYPL